MGSGGQAKVVPRERADRIRQVDEAAQIRIRGANRDGEKEEVRRSETRPDFFEYGANWELLVWCRFERSPLSILRGRWRQLRWRRRWPRRRVVELVAAIAGEEHAARLAFRPTRVFKIPT